jgi:tRNA pseudouridine38-40 synthase
VTTRNIALRLSYDGTDFVGSQWQNNGRTVQGAIEGAWEQLTQERRRFVLAGRTDAGVHAQGQMANVRTETHHDLATLIRGMNALLPEDVAVLEVREVHADFHARFSAVRREYRYLIDTAPVAAPLLRRHVVHVPQQLDRAAMAQALALLLGEHDFAAFAGAGPPDGSTVRRCVLAACGTVELFERELVAINLAANAFLRHMVRNIVGTLLLVGQRRLDPGAFGQVLKSRNRRQAGPTAPAHGLYLMSVSYPDWTNGQQAGVSPL